MKPSPLLAAIIFLPWAAVGLPTQASAAVIPVRLATPRSPAVVLAPAMLGLAGGGAPVYKPPRTGAWSVLPAARAATAALPALSVSGADSLSGPASLKVLLAEPESFSLSSQALDRLGTDGARETGTEMMDRVLGTRSSKAPPADASAAAQPEADHAPGVSSTGLERPDRAPAQSRRSGRVVPLMATAAAGASLLGHAAAAHGLLIASPVVLVGAAALLLLAALFILIPLADVAQQDGDSWRESALGVAVSLFGLSAISVLSAALTAGAYWKLAAAASGLALLYLVLLSPSIDAAGGGRRAAGSSGFRSRSGMGGR